MKPHHLSVTRTARYFLLGDPHRPAEELVLGLHGHAQLAARFLRFLAPLDDGATLLAAPEALSRFYLETRLNGQHGPAIGATWLTREHREPDLQDHYAYLDRLLAHLLADQPRRPRLTLLGFSQGAVLASRWLAAGGRRMDRVILWGVPLAHDLPLDAFMSGLAGAPVHLVAGDADAYAPAGTIEEDAARLAAAGGTGVARRFARGHTLPPDELRAVMGRSPAA
ncbi:MAG TPA: hypothetical protein PKA50_14615 [Gemmatimonadales bacterium]|nr:hypothetical protein [Gemmatimonadales bacterium]